MSSVISGTYTIYGLLMVIYNRAVNRLLTGKFRNDQDIGLTLFVMTRGINIQQ